MLVGRKTLAVAIVLLVAAGSYFVLNALTAPPGGAGGVDKSGDSELRAMVEQVLPKFQQLEYTDAETGLTVPYNLFVPESHDKSNPLPLVYFIADSSVVGRAVTAPLSQGYGGLIWAIDENQAAHPSLVLVPEFPEVILDDHGSYTTTDYVELSARLVETVAEEQGADLNRLYATGQSMGCMALMYLSAQHPDLFAAQLFVSGQWDVGTLGNLTGETFFYVVAEGDPKASKGQEELYQALTAGGADISRATWDANWPEGKMTEAVKTMLSEGNEINFVTFSEGSVMPEGISASGGSGEHMYSFDPAYRIDALRDWLFVQSK